MFCYVRSLEYSAGRGFEPTVRAVVSAFPFRHESVSFCPQVSTEARFVAARTQVCSHTRDECLFGFCTELFNSRRQEASLTLILTRHRTLSPLYTHFRKCTNLMKLKELTVKMKSTILSYSGRGDFAAELYIFIFQSRKILF
jgi:hypothetical protein